MLDQSIAWMISGGTRERREDALQSIHRHALAEADASRSAENRINPNLRRAVASLFQLPGADRASAIPADCAC